MIPLSRRHVTKQQYVYETLREAIIRCELPPGERLVIDELARRLDISIIPVREALRLLESEGLVFSVAHVGATVAPISRHSIVEVFTLLEGLETVSARAAALAAAGGGADLAELDALVDEMDAALATDQQDAWAELNSRFHLAISSVSGMPMLEQMLGRALDHWDRVRRHFFTGVLARRADIAQGEHRDMVAYIRAGDADAVEQLARLHHRGALDAYTAYMEAHEHAPVDEFHAAGAVERT
jgi:DNA-binding GntR family transcriptional regulator